MKQEKQIDHWNENSEMKPHIKKKKSCNKLKENLA